MHRQIEIFYVLDGAIEITVAGRKQLMKKGMVSIAFPNVVHETCTPDHSSAVMIIFDHTFLPDFSVELNTHQPKTPFLSSLPDPEHFSLMVHGLLESTQKYTYIRISKGYLYFLTAMILSQVPLARQEDLYDSGGICQDISNYLNQHFT